MATVKNTFTTTLESPSSIWVESLGAFSSVLLTSTATYVEAVDPTTTRTSWIDAGPDFNSFTTSNTASSATSRVTTSAATSSVSISGTFTASSSPASATASTPSDASNISTGTLAGTAIGCTVGGLFLGFVAAWFLLRRRKDKTHDAAGTSPESNDETKTAIIASPSSTTSDTQLDHFLLAATPDREIKSELQALGNLIAQHVENNYHSGLAPSHSVLSQALVQLGFSHRADAVASMCVKPESRSIGLRHVISQTIFRSIDVHSRSSISMLPAPIAASLQAVPQHNDLAASLALSKWRRLSAFLLHPNPNERTPLPILESTVAPQAVALATALNMFLYYFVDEGCHDAQTSHLQAVILECTKLGYELLSQPQDWQFVFEKDGSGLVVVCPGLDRLGGRESRGRRVADPDAVQLDAR
ncbi:hypothetical protein B0T10DRAFT_523065 [Thelonectria olida]|uniref:Uncharacterized protein n=1 Tax=Thelonectria olida TaxID=1576542 RepID=A0A9P8VPX1_9HYPO|nr:hypothetical protein B0T10DRAFT_523065 [Thelonectria olida]